MLKMDQKSMPIAVVGNNHLDPHINSESLINYNLFQRYIKYFL